MTGNVQSACWVLLSILWHRMMVEKVHEGTVGNKWHDPFCFVIRGLETANPAKNNHKSQAQHAKTETIQPRGRGKEGPDHARVLTLSGAGQGLVGRRCLCRCTDHVGLHVLLLRTCGEVPEYLFRAY